MYNTSMTNFVPGKYVLFLNCLGLKNIENDNYSLQTLLFYLALRILLFSLGLIYFKLNNMMTCCVTFERKTVHSTLMRMNVKIS